ncbi:hypothetical protein ARMGADRAFT_321925 [Armillaria gallica]|uniref:Uncharacterized protein n=1 Tax=Armillaria gallica TaxID=47427 RepID=A0A2H3D754_ARMGA|nr:hypothetical protein ARMGADRAFT_321925 [Armillaria gallica]
MFDAVDRIGCNVIASPKAELDATCISILLPILPTWTSKNAHLIYTHHCASQYLPCSTSILGSEVSSPPTPHLRDLVFGTNASWPRRCESFSRQDPLAVYLSCHTCTFFAH